jgi:hypothetical protein
MRICSRCKQKKSEENFNFKNRLKGLRQYHCKNCSRLYTKKHYDKNKKYYLQKAHLRNQKIRSEIKTYVWRYLSNHSCVDCGEKDPIVLEFDHIDSKNATISEMYRNYTLEMVKVEIGKCQVRCANCHRRKTAKERGWNKSFLPS